MSKALKQNIYSSSSQRNLPGDQEFDAKFLSHIFAQNSKNAKFRDKYDSRDISPGYVSTDVKKKGILTQRFSNSQSHLKDQKVCGTAIASSELGQIKNFPRRNSQAPNLQKGKKNFYNSGHSSMICQENMFSPNEKINPQPLTYFQSPILDQFLISDDQKNKSSEYSRKYLEQQFGKFLVQSTQAKKVNIPEKYLKDVVLKQFKTNLSKQKNLFQSKKYSGSPSLNRTGKDSKQRNSEYSTTTKTLNKAPSTGRHQFLNLSSHITPNSRLPIPKNIKPSPSPTSTTKKVNFSDMAFSNMLPSIKQKSRQSLAERTNNRRSKQDLEFRVQSYIKNMSNSPIMERQVKSVPFNLQKKSKVKNMGGTSQKHQQLNRQGMNSMLQVESLINDKVDLALNLVLANKGQTTRNVEYSQSPKTVTKTKLRGNKNQKSAQLLQQCQSLNFTLQKSQMLKELSKNLKCKLQYQSKPSELGKNQDILTFKLLEGINISSNKQNSKNITEDSIQKNLNLFKRKKQSSPAFINKTQQSIQSKTLQKLRKLTKLQVDENACTLSISKQMENQGYGSIFNYVPYSDQQQISDQQTIKRSKIDINQRLKNLNNTDETPKKFMNEQSVEQEKPLNNTYISQDEMQRQVEAKLHFLQFQKVFYKQDSSSQINQSGISNFSMELEMLNKLQVSKNNPNPLENLPVVYDKFIQDSNEIYKEEQNSKGNIRFVKDGRPKVLFEDPFKKTLKRGVNVLNQQIDQSEISEKHQVETSSFDNQKTMRFDISQNNEQLLFQQIPEISSHILTENESQIGMSKNFVDSLILKDDQQYFDKTYLKDKRQMNQSDLDLSQDQIDILNSIQNDTDQYFEQASSKQIPNSELDESKSIYEFNQKKLFESFNDAQTITLSSISSQYLYDENYINQKLQIKSKCQQIQLYPTLQCQDLCKRLKPSIFNQVGFHLQNVGIDLEYFNFDIQNQPLDESYLLV